MGTVEGGRTVQHAPLMRPLTPSSVGPSLHQIEHQLLEAKVQLENYTSGLLANFDMMRCQQPMADVTGTSSSPPRMTQRGEVGEKGLEFNSGNRREKAICTCNGYLKDGEDGRWSDERRPVSGHGSRPSTRGSRCIIIGERKCFLELNCYMISPTPSHTHTHTHTKQSCKNSRSFNIRL